MRSTRTVVALVLATLTALPALPAQARPAGDDGSRRPVTQSHILPGEKQEGVEISCVTTRGPRTSVTLYDNDVRGSLLTITRPEGAVSQKSSTPFLTRHRFIDASTDLAGVPMRVTGTVTPSGLARYVEERVEDETGSVITRGWEWDLRTHLRLVVGRTVQPLSCDSAIGFRHFVQTIPRAPAPLVPEATIR